MPHRGQSLQVTGGDYVGDTHDVWATGVKLTGNMSSNNKTLGLDIEK